MSYTMNEFINTINEIKALEEKKNAIRQFFENSTEELKECFHLIVGTALEGKNSCCITTGTCPELYAKELEGMGFTVNEMRNICDNLCGYRISWNIE